MAKKVLIVGGSGLIGTRLVSLLESKGYKPFILSRTKINPLRNHFHWNPEKSEIDPDSLQIPIVINLAGAGIADKKWTEQRKKILFNSRVESTNFLFESFEKTNQFPEVYIGGSAIGFYGNRGMEKLKEESSVGEGFLAGLTKSWEDAHQRFTNKTKRFYLPRIGIVLSLKGGALAKSVTPTKLGIASYFGNGMQKYSWIHIDDLCQIIIKMIDDQTLASGIYNAVSPNPIDNKSYTLTLRKIVNRFSLLVSAPASILRLLLGEMANIVLDSSWVSSKKLQKHGFQFKFPYLEDALKDVINRKI